MFEEIFLYLEKPRSMKRRRKIYRPFLFMYLEKYRINREEQEKVLMLLFWLGGTNPADNIMLFHSLDLACILYTHLKRLWSKNCYIFFHTTLAKLQFFQFFLPTRIFILFIE